MSAKQVREFVERSANGVSNHELCHEMLTCCCNGTMMSTLVVVMNTDNSHDLCSFSPSASWQTQKLSCC